MRPAPIQESSRGAGGTVKPSPRGASILQHSRSPNDNQECRWQKVVPAKDQHQRSRGTRETAGGSVTTALKHSLHAHSAAQKGLPQP